MKDFEQLYSEIESKYKDELRSLKRKALVIRYIRLFTILIILIIISAVLLKIKGTLAYPAIMICAFFSIPLYYIIDYVTVALIKRKNPYYKQAKDLYREFYCKNVANDFVEEKYNLKFEFDEYFNKDILNQSKITINNVNSIDQRYKLSGDLKLLNEFNNLEIFIVSTLKYTGTNTDTDAGSNTLKYSIFAVCKIPNFNNIDLEINNVKKFSAFVKNSNITLSYNIESYLINLKRTISVTIKDSYFYLCIHNCHNLEFFIGSEKKSLKELCKYIDLIKDIILVFKENII